MSTQIDPGEQRQTFGDAFADFILKIRKSVLHGIEQLVRFCELLLLAGAFEYAGSKTKDPYLQLLALLLSIAALIYISEFVVWSTNGIKLPKKRGWWRWTVVALLAAYLFWNSWASTKNVSKAINALANTAVQF